MTSATVNKRKFGEQLYNIAVEQAATPQGKEELKGFDEQQFLTAVKSLGDAIDNLPEGYTLNNLYLAVNFLGAAIVGTIEAHRKLKAAPVAGNG